MLYQSLPKIRRLRRNTVTTKLTEETKTPGLILPSRIISCHKDIKTQAVLLAWLYSQSNKVVGREGGSSELQLFPDSSQLKLHQYPRRKARR